MENKFDNELLKTVGSLKEALPLIEQLESANMQNELLSVMQHENVDIKIEGLKSLQKIGNTEVLPPLIDLLSQSNFPVIGSEAATLHKIYKENLCKTISAISGNDYKINNINDEREINSIVQSMKSWTEKNIKNKDV
jgi:HEAT repeat protein